MRDPFEGDVLVDQVVKYARSHAAPVLVGEPPGSLNLELYNGTMTLLKLGSRFLGVTCSHVVNKYRELSNSAPTLFQVRHAIVDLDRQLVSESREHDLATIDLTPYVGNGTGLEESNFVRPIVWPPDPVSEGDPLSLAGCPGVWREQTGVGDLKFGWVNAVVAPVLSVTEHQIKARFEIEDCIVDAAEGVTFGDIGGISGGPAFSWRRNPTPVPELVGFIYEYSYELDLIMIRSADVISEDGEIM